MDRNLVVRARAGDHSAFAELARISIGRLFAVAQLMLRDAASAEDAVQETLVAAWRDLSSLRDPDRFEGWLRRLLVRSCYRQIARNQRTRRLEMAVTAIDMSEPDRSVEVADRDQLERAFRRLAPDQRAIIVLHYYTGLTLVDVADTLGIPMGTVKSRWHRALRALRADLDSETRSLLLQKGQTA